jgi:predicted acylesterase/phospholipase RssA
MNINPILPKKLRIILPSGGVKGCFQIGALSQILASGNYQIDKVYGCSIGAILAPFVACGNMQQLIDTFSSIKGLDDVVEQWEESDPISFIGEFKSLKLADTLFKLLNDDETKIAKDICHVVSYDVINNVEKWFTGEELEIGIKCSSALWLAVPPVPYNGGLFCDGGATEIFPVDYILDHELNEPFDGFYLFIDCDSRQPYINEIPTDGLSLMSALHWAATSRLAQLQLSKLKDSLQDKLIIVKPDVNFLLASFDVDPIRMSQTFYSGALKGATTFIP